MTFYKIRNKYSTDQKSYEYFKPLIILYTQNKFIRFLVSDRYIFTILKTPLMYDLDNVESKRFIKLSQTKVKGLLQLTNK